MINKIKLGASSLEVSRICLGTMTFGEQNSEAEAHRQLDYALERGINFIDTAEMEWRFSSKDVKKSACSSSQ